MIGAFYSTSRIPVTLPIIIAITALCRLIVMQSKESEALVPGGGSIRYPQYSVALLILCL